MSGTSSKTTLITLRLPREVVCTLERRINGRQSHWWSVREYLQERIIYDTERLHTKKRRLIKE